MSVLRWLLDREKRPRVVVTTPEAVLRRVPPRCIWKSIHLEFRSGDRIEPEDVQGRLEAIGYGLMSASTNPAKPRCGAW